MAIATGIPDISRTVPTKQFNKRPSLYDTGHDVCAKNEIPFPVPCRTSPPCIAVARIVGCDKTSKGSNIGRMSYRCTRWWALWAG